MMEMVNGNYVLSDEELRVFDSFFQYGNFKKAKYIFVGIEEGLCRGSYEETIESRMLLHTKYKNEIDYFNESEGVKGGWFVNNPNLLPKVEHEVKKSTENLEDFMLERPFDLTMRMHLRLSMLLETPLKSERLDFSSLNDFKNAHKLNKIHSENGKTAMFDFFPLPKQGKFPYIVEGKFKNEKDYRKYYLKNDNDRVKILKKLYDHYPMEISFVYTGETNNDFKLLKFYENVLGFEFDEFKTTASVHEKYQDIIKPSEKPKKFLIGKRPSGQIAILTPFWGLGRMSYNDIDVVATWLHDFIYKVTEN